MSPILSTVDVSSDLKNVVWSDRSDLSSMVGGKPSYWVIRDKYCPGNNDGSHCFDGTCEFAKKYPGGGGGKPCLEFVRKMEAAKSVDAGKV